MCFIFMGGFGLLDFEMFYDCCVFLCVFWVFWRFWSVLVIWVSFGIFRIFTVVPENPGFPQATSGPLISLTSILLVLDISSRYLFQSTKDIFGEFLQISR
jgi:hypothetical protein